MNILHAQPPAFNLHTRLNHSLHLPSNNHLELNYWEHCGSTNQLRRR